MASIRTAHPEHIQVIKVRTAEDYQQLVEYLRRPEQVVKDFPGGWVLDTVSYLRELCARHVLAAALEKDAQEKTDEKKAHDPEILNQQDWGRVANRIRDISRLLRDIDGVPGIMLCQQDVDRDEKGNITDIRPMLSDKLLGIVPGDYDVVGYLEVRTIRDQKVKEEVTTRTIRFQRTGLIMAKDRTEALGKIFTVEGTGPTMVDLIDTIKQG
jgi:hypothetical protein